VPEFWRGFESPGASYRTHALVRDLWLGGERRLLFRCEIGSMQSTAPIAHGAQMMNQMPPTQATDQMLLTELQKRRCADPTVIQHVTAAFSLLNMVEGMLSYPQGSSNPAAPAIPSTTGAQNTQAPQQAVSQPRAEQSASAAIQGSTEDLLRNVQKKNQEMRSMLSGQVRTCIMRSQPMPPSISCLHPDMQPLKCRAFAASRFRANESTADWRAHAASAIRAS
jgi:hypothetical protein